jgi:hypothetical protein
MWYPSLNYPLAATFPPRLFVKVQQRLANQRRMFTTANSIATSLAPVSFGVLSYGGLPMASHVLRTLNSTRLDTRLHSRPFLKKTLPGSTCDGTC